jgi:hypothetical protein
MTCTKYLLAFQITLHNLNKYELSVWTSFRYNCIIMLMFRIVIHFQLTAMASNGSSKGTGRTSAKTPTTVINRELSLDRECVKGFISEDICGLIQAYNLCGVKDETAWDLIYDIIFLDPVTSCHCSQFQQMWPHRRSRSSHFWVWLAAFRSYMGQMFDKTRNQMFYWRWDNFCACG